ncbi:MAG: SDR family oxidoreductase [Armatimonadetes bacterium]|nr:SDR family oxidoreductase [Armatimonadota bacterium]
MELGLAGKIIIITGGAKGIGEGIAHAVAQEGAVAVIVGRSDEGNRATAESIRAAGGKAFPIEAELTRTGDSRRAVEAALAEFGRIDGLANNAGENDGVGLETGDTEKFITSLRKNLIHYYEMAKFALPALIESRGSILNIGSKVAETGQGGTSAYAAANGGRNALTREWALDLCKYGIRVNAIIVAECLTPMYERWLTTQPDPAAARATIESRIPFGNRMTTTDEIGAMAAFLLSDRSSHTTGQLIHVDGGYVHLDRPL